MRFRLTLLCAYAAKTLGFHRIGQIAASLAHTLCPPCSLHYNPILPLPTPIAGGERCCPEEVHRHSRGQGRRSHPCTCTPAASCMPLQSSACHSALAPMHTANTVSHQNLASGVHTAKYCTSSRSLCFPTSSSVHHLTPSFLLPAELAKKRKAGQYSHAVHAHSLNISHAAPAPCRMHSSPPFSFTCCTMQRSLPFQLQLAPLPLPLPTPTNVSFTECSPCFYVSTITPCKRAPDSLTQTLRCHCSSYTGRERQ